MSYTWAVADISLMDCCYYRPWNPIKTLDGNMMPAAESIAGDTSNLLRDILQNKGKNLNNNDSKSLMMDENSSQPRSDLSDQEMERESEEESFEDQKEGDWTVSDSKEAKRARVENILSNMRQVSSDNDDIPSSKSLDVKRPKRKQLQPQQHDGRSSSPDAKYRKVEHIALQEHIRQLQQQLQAVKRKCDKLCDDDEEGGITHKRSDELLTNGGSRSPSEDLIRSELNSNHVMRHMHHLLNEHDRLGKMPSSLSLNHVGDLQTVVDSLKAEILGAISKVVENALSKIVEHHVNKDNETKKVEDEKRPTPPPERKTVSPKPEIVENSLSRASEKQSAFDAVTRDSDLIRSHIPHHVPFPHFPYYMPTQVPPPFFGHEPEQTEALPLLVNTPKKKRTKVTDTRLSPRAKAALLDSAPGSSQSLELERSFQYPHFLPHVLPTTVAIPNPSLNQSDILSFSSMRDNMFAENRLMSHSPPNGNDSGSPRSPSDSFSHLNKSDYYDVSPNSEMDNGLQMTSNLSPMHLRKAKLMFFFVRYPSSAILKVYFPDIRFNKNNTAQLVKWFSNFREFYYIQMEKFARQAIAEGCKHTDDLVVTSESELYRVLNLHYNRNNQIEVPETFRVVVQATLREFFKAISAGKDLEPSWKKAIYKVIARMDDVLPDFFKSPNWLERLGDA